MDALQKALDDDAAATAATSSNGGIADGILPEAQNLKWKDTFFHNEEGHIATFDFDYPLIESFQTKVALASMAFAPVLIFGSIFACYPCLYKQQVQWDTYAKHVAVTQDGIKFVHDKRKTCCGLDCTDAGKISKTVPFDKITDCDITEPAGATCFCVDNVLSVVNIDTASGGGGGDGPSHELILQGLKEPYNFKKLVWAMKRATAQGGISKLPTTSAPPVAQSAMNRGESNEDTNAILRDIRSELRELNANIKNQR